MKTIVKICCGVLAFGLVLWALGFAFGGRPLSMSEVPGLRAATSNVVRTIDHLSWDWRWGDRWDWNWDDTWNDTWDDDLDWDDGDAPANSASGKVTAARSTLGGDSTANGASMIPTDLQGEVRRIELQLGAGEFELREANEHEGIEPFSVSADGVYFKHYDVGLDGDTWKAELVCSPRRGNQGPVILYLPAGAVWTEFDVELGAGSLDTDAVYAEQSKLSVGAGSVDMYLDSREVDVEVGAGGVTLTMPGKWSEYGYNIECGLGGVTVNGDAVINGVGEVKRQGTPMLDLQIAAGGVDIFTTEG